MPLFCSCFLSGVENCNLYYILFSGELPPSSGHWDSLRSLLGLLEEYKDRAPRYTTPAIIDEITIVFLDYRSTLCCNIGGSSLHGPQ